MIWNIVFSNPVTNAEFNIQLAGLFKVRSYENLQSHINQGKVNTIDLKIFVVINVV